MRNLELEATKMWERSFNQLHVLHQFVASVIPESLGVDTRVKAFDGIQRWYTGLRTKHREMLSARVTLQTLGTEWGRETYENIWLDYLFNVQVPLLAEGYRYQPELGVCTFEEPGLMKNGICIPDQRFVNELSYTGDKGGYSVRVRRLSRVKTDGTNVGIQGHKSEQEQKGIPDTSFDKVFNFPEGLDLVNGMLSEWAEDSKFELAVK